MRRLVILAVFVLLVPCSGKAADIKDWTVGCDNLNGCIAFGFPAEGDSGDAAFVRIARAAGPESAPEIRLTIIVDQAPANNDMQLSMDGKPIEGVAFTKKAVGAEDGRMNLQLAPDEIQPFIAALRHGRMLELATPDGKDKAVISLDGAGAALLKMDDVQGRIGTKTALIRSGDKPASVVPAAPSMPIVVAVKPPADAKADVRLARELRARLKKDKKLKDCDDVGATSGGDAVGALGRTTALVGIACGRGAYNVESRFWVVTKGDIGTAVPAVFATPGEKPNHALVNATFDHNTAKISFFDKASGVGDCGAAGDYVWTGTGFALADFFFMGDCHGVDQEDWPVLWRTQVQ